MPEEDQTVVGKPPADLGAKWSVDSVELQEKVSKLQHFQCTVDEFWD